MVSSAAMPIEPTMRANMPARRQCVRQIGIRIDDVVVVEEQRARNMARLVFGARIALVRRQVPRASTIDRPGWPSRSCSQSAVTKMSGSLIVSFPTRCGLGISFACFQIRPETAATRDHCAGSGPKRMRKRRFSRPFFSILPIWISPTSPVAFTCVPPQGWLSIDRVVADADQPDAAGADRRPARSST